MSIITMGGTGANRPVVGPKKPKLNLPLRTTTSPKKAPEKKKV